MNTSLDESALVEVSAKLQQSNTNKASRLMNPGVVHPSRPSRVSVLG
jgi:hypothetical protein